MISNDIPDNMWGRWCCVLQPGQAQLQLDFQLRSPLLLLPIPAADVFPVLCGNPNTSPYLTVSPGKLFPSCRFCRGTIHTQPQHLRVLNGWNRHNQVAYAHESTPSVLRFPSFRGSVPVIRFPAEFDCGNSYKFALPECLHTWILQPVYGNTCNPYPTVRHEFYDWMEQVVQVNSQHR